ncbi:spore germination protein [Shimazuella kribbensis]|uniref:spore germination protein n=1 Tax=Shimazuella kribbensis TaxID=139808 RepID=UPI000414BB6D|nr:spore germination protein [Shimazuella kribbensis]
MKKTPQKPDSSKDKKSTHPPKTFVNQLSKNVNAIKEQLEDCGDVKFVTKRIQTESQDRSSTFIYCDGLIDTQRMNQEIFHEIYKWVGAANFDPSSLPLSTIRISNDDISVIEYLFEGYLICLIDGMDHAFCFDIAKIPQRQPEETPSETAIRGSRDGFTESLTTNVALIRKRIKSGSLKCKIYQIGTRSKTKVALMYIEDVIQPEMLEEVTKSLSNIQIDTLTTSQQLQELMDRSSSIRLLPLFDYTSRPDFISSYLNHGRFCLIVDGNPTVPVAPTSLTSLLKSSEDIHSMVIVNSMQYILRLCGLLISLLLPAFWTAITYFHPNQIPISLLSTLMLSRKGIPFPIPIETILMLLVFEIFREAGLRLPIQVGQTLSVVGGLIVGDAAIRSGLTSPSTVVVIAMSFVASSTLINQSVVGMISLIRLFLLFLSAFLGIFGFVLALFVVVLYLSQLKSFGVPYLAPVSPFYPKDFIRTVFRPSWKKIDQRPSMLKTKDNTTSEEGTKE